MKRRIISAVLGISMAASAWPAFAEDGTAVLYNNEPKTITQPVITQTVQLLPFRDVAETAGVQVGFDAGQKQVTAVWDGQKAAFGLQDDIISVYNEAGECIRSTAVNHRTIQDDRLYLDGMSLGNALGMQIGWDEAAQAIYIVDVAKYTDELFAGTPGLEQLFTVFGQTPEKYKSNTEMKIQFDMTANTGENGEPQATNLEVTITEDAQKTAEAAKEAIAIDLETLNLPEAVEGVDFSKLQGINIETVTDANGVCYIQTNLIEKLAETLPAIEELQTAAKVISPGIWMKLDLSALLEQMGMQDLLKPQDAETMKSIMESTLTSAADMSVYSVKDAKAIDGVFDMYQTMFGEPYFKITGSDEAGWELAWDMDREQMADMIRSMGEKMGEDTAVLEADLAGLEAMDIHLNAALSPAGEMTMDMDMTIGAKDDASNVNFVITMDSTMTPDPDGEPIEIPTVFIDIMKIGELLNL